MVSGLLLTQHSSGAFGKRRYLDRKRAVVVFPESAAAAVYDLIADGRGSAASLRSFRSLPAASSRLNIQGCCKWYGPICRCDDGKFPASRQDHQCDRIVCGIARYDEGSRLYTDHASAIFQYGEETRS